MPNTIGGGTLVEAPSSLPYGCGLFSVAAPAPGPAGWERGVSWESQACGSARVTRGYCNDETIDALTADNPCFVKEFAAFQVYSYTTQSLGLGVDGLDDVRERLLVAEQEAVETELWTLLTATSPTTVTAGGSLAYGIGWVEQRLAEVYGNQGVIHLNRLAATLGIAQNVLVSSGRSLRTILGTPVVAGGGYAEVGAAGVPTTFTIYGTGPLVLYRGDVRPVGSDAPSAVNSASAIASRPFLVGWDCATIGAVSAK